MQADRQTRQACTYIAMQGMFFDLMAGEISPNIMFSEIRRTVGAHKCTKMGCYGLRMGAMVCMGKGGTRNKSKRYINARAGHILACMVTAKKYSKLAGMVAVTGMIIGAE